MSTEKMREEFQEWAWNKYHDVFWYELDRAHVFRPYKDGYQTEFLNVRWDAWQASRAAIEVELPSDVGETLGGEYYYCHDVVKILESLGLKVKP